jgi:hypothetical protein
MKVSRVKLSEQAALGIIQAAIRGYEAPYKEERLGILLGRAGRGEAAVDLAKAYKARQRTRTFVEVDGPSMDRAVGRLARRHRRRYLGTYHTHPEVANGIILALSADDKMPLCPSYEQFIEVIATIWASDQPARQSRYYYQLKIGDYRIRIAAYRFGGDFTILPVRVRGW